VSACYLEIHPLANLFPKRSEERIRALAQDMRENGQRDKITLYKGKLLEGRHRHWASMINGVEAEWEEYSGKETPEALLAFVISKNGMTHNLTKSQQACVAQEAATAKEGGYHRPNSVSDDDASLAYMAAKFGVSRTSAVEARALQRKDPHIYQRVKQGEISSLNAGCIQAGLKEKKSPKPKSESFKPEAQQQPPVDVDPTIAQRLMKQGFIREQATDFLTKVAAQQTSGDGGMAAPEKTPESQSANTGMTSGEAAEGVEDDANDDNIPDVPGPDPEPDYVPPYPENAAPPRSQDMCIRLNQMRELDSRLFQLTPGGNGASEREIEKDIYRGFENAEVVLAYGSIGQAAKLDPSLFEWVQAVAKKFNDRLIQHRKTWIAQIAALKPLIMPESKATEVSVPIKGPTPEQIAERGRASWEGKVAEGGYIQSSTSEIAATKGEQEEQQDDNDEDNEVDEEEIEFQNNLFGGTPKEEAEADELFDQVQNGDASVTQEPPAEVQSEPEQNPEQKELDPITTDATDTTANVEEVKPEQNGIAPASQGRPKTLRERNRDKLETAFVVFGNPRDHSLGGLLTALDQVGCDLSRCPAETLSKFCALYFSVTVIAERLPKMLSNNGTMERVSAS